MGIAWNTLTSEVITNWYLYGTPDTPDVYSERIRNSDTGNTTLRVDTVGFMMDGPGRYAINLFSEFGIVRYFFAQALANPERTGEVTLLQLLTEMGSSLTRDGNYTDQLLAFVNKDIDSASADYADRTYVWGSVSFKLADATFVFNGTESTIADITLLPFNTDFDFHSDNTLTDWGGALVLLPTIDPYLLGEISDAVRRKVKLDFDNKEAAQGILSEYSFSRFSYDVINDRAHNEVYTGTNLSTWNAISDVIDRLKLGGVIDCARADGVMTSYGTNQRDILAVRDAEKPGIVVAGDGNDTICNCSPLPSR